MKVLFVILIVATLLCDLYLLYYVIRYAFDGKKGHMASGIAGTLFMSVNIYCVMQVFLRLIK